MTACGSVTTRLPPSMTAPGFPASSSRTWTRQCGDRGLPAAHPMDSDGRGGTETPDGTRYRGATGPRAEASEHRLVGAAGRPADEDSRGLADVRPRVPLAAGPRRRLAAPRDLTGVERALQRPVAAVHAGAGQPDHAGRAVEVGVDRYLVLRRGVAVAGEVHRDIGHAERDGHRLGVLAVDEAGDRKSTRLNSSHQII